MRNARVQAEAGIHSPEKAETVIATDETSILDDSTEASEEDLEQGKHPTIGFCSVQKDTAIFLCHVRTNDKIFLLLTTKNAD